ncbi:MAG: thymidine phosphorylase [Clostridia bacterium]|nr:thymidine phosphorylase [Clostridia bacterium]
MYDLIQKKKEGKPLKGEEIAFFVHGFTQGRIPDYQASALLMAICLRGMNEEETAILTREMMHSGSVVDLSSFGNATVDKHSTGGVGDKTTLILAPIVASAGCILAKMSGRGLGFTGGTVDKMESVPGMRTSFDSEEFFSVVRRVGVCVAGQSEGLVPADKKLYALRDVTATIDSIPLIASSIMSKKLASGARNIVLDVKFGSGAFMKTPEEACRLGEAMVRIGRSLDRRVVAVVSDMDTPLGFAVGNAPEVREAIEILSGRGDESLRELCLLLAGKMISAARSLSEAEGAALARTVLEEKRALMKMKEWIAAQGGDARVVEDPTLLPLSPIRHQVLAPSSGILARMDSEGIGTTAMLLGAGRRTKNDVIDHGAGLVLNRKTGDRVEKGELLATLYTTRQEAVHEAEERFLDSLSFSEEPVAKKPLVHRIIE